MRRRPTSLSTVDDVDLSRVVGGLDGSCVAQNSEVIAKHGLPLADGGGVVHLSPVQVGPAALALCNQDIHLY